MNLSVPPRGFVEAVAVEAYVYVYPLVLMDITRRVTESFARGVRPGFGPMNEFTHLRAFPPGDFKEVVRPNFDTLYSTLWFDLTDGPVVVSAPDTTGRYYMLPFLDMWTDVFAVVGTRTTGSVAGHYAIVPPGWSGSLPPEVARIDSPTPVGWVIGRTQTNGVEDYPAVHLVQDGFVATPLSQWPGPVNLGEPAPSGDVDVATPPLVQVESMSGPEMLTYGLDLMQRHSPHVVDQPILARMARAGLRPGQPLEPGRTDPDLLAAVAQAPAAALARMTKAQAHLAPVVNGWSMATFGMGAYGTDYLRRAVVARIGLGANLVQDAIYPVALTDADGNPPSGDQRYVLHFDADEIPPVEAFWSVTMYDGDGFTVPNGLDRYALGDRDPLVVNRDGSLDLYLQHEDPGDEHRANWLPAPRGPLGVTLRLYSPRPAALDGTWSPPPLRRV